MYWINDDSDNWRCTTCAVRGNSRHAHRPKFSIQFSTISSSRLKIWTCETSISTRRAKPVVSTIWAYLRAPDLRESGHACKLFTCCRSARRVPSSGWFPVWLVWWWFENSRACLYYFFIVNDCQFVAGHADAWCRGIGQTAARFLCDAPFLIRRSSIFLFRESSCRCLFMKRFFCGGFDSGSG